jgi:hypothetical protein
MEIIFMGRQMLAINRTVLTEQKNKSFEFFCALEPLCQLLAVMYFMEHSLMIPFFCFFQNHPSRPQPLFEYTLDNDFACSTNELCDEINNEQLRHYRQEDKLVHHTVFQLSWIFYLQTVF